MFLENRAIRARAQQLRPKLYRVAFAWTHDTAQADDLVQETLAKALERLRQLREPERFEAWLFRILANCWRDHLRARLDTQDIDEMEHLECPLPNPEARLSTLQVVVRVRTAVSRLPMGQRQVVTLVDLGEFSYSDAAMILEIPVGTVMSRLCRAREALRTMLEERPSVVVPLRPGKFGP
jgi:RNA polymerase sigma-70 factor (ECF subfamily)